MDYLYINNKGKYERVGIKNKKELKKTLLFLISLSLLSLSVGVLYLMTNYI